MKKTFLLIGFIMFSFLKNVDSQTTVVLQPGPEGKDAQLWSIMPNSNYANSPKFVCSGWTHYGEPGVNRSLIDFDLSMIPENAEITEAKLSFYFACLEPTYFGHTGDNQAYLQLITETWEEDGVTWNTQPLTTEADQLYLPPSTDPYMDYTDLDVTGLINKLFTEPDNYHGLMLKLINEFPYQCLLFVSGDYTDTIEFRPQLEVTYTVPPENTVVIQPGAEGKDAQLWSIMPNTNYGNTPKFVCMGWTHYGEPGVNRALIDFDLSVVPENAVITEAKLSFCFVNLEPTYFGHTGDNEAYLKLITESWEEENVTWNTQPMTTENDQVYLPPSKDPYQDYTDLDVTGLIKKLFTEPDNYHGLMLKLINEYPYQCLLFASSDYSDTIEFRPRLVITYTICQSPVAGFDYQIDDLIVYFQDITEIEDGRYWDFGDGYYSDLLNPWHTYDEPGDYTVCLRSWNSCGSDSICQVISLLNETMISEKTSFSFSVYPNPANTVFTISTGLESHADVTIFDLSGRIMLKSYADFSSEESVKLNISQFPQGIYFVRISSGKFTETQKVFVSH